jgi:hypothetical protein
MSTERSERYWELRGRDVDAEHQRLSDLLGVYQQALIDISMIKGCDEARNMARKVLNPPLRVIG